MAVRLNTQYVKSFIDSAEYDKAAAKVAAAHEMLHDGTGLGNDFLGWLELPTNYDKEEFDRIKKSAAKIKEDTDVFIVIGIGGSYLGARAAIEFLTSPNYNLVAKNTPQIFYAGNSIPEALCIRRFIPRCISKPRGSSSSAQLYILCAKGSKLYRKRNPFLCVQMRQ